MKTIRSGPYVFRLGLYPDADLSPANLGEAFDYYSGVPGWGWRVVTYREHGQWDSPVVEFGALVNDLEYALPNPEGEMESYFPCGRAVHLVDGGIAFEGGVAIPPRALPGLGDLAGVWVSARGEAGTHGAEVRFRLVENERWDGLEPRECVAGPRTASRARQTWSPVEEPLHNVRLPSPTYVEPARLAVAGGNNDTVEKAIELARDEGSRQQQGRPGSEDLLLGLLRAASGQAFDALQAEGVTLRGARAAVQFLRTTTLGTQPTHGSALLPSAEKALQLAADEARRDGSEKVRSRHLLAGLLRQAGGAAAALNWLGVTEQALRDTLARTNPTDES